MPFGKTDFTFGNPCVAYGGERGGGGGGRERAAGGGVNGCVTEVYSAILGRYGSKSVTVLPDRNGARAAPVGGLTNHGSRGTGCAYIIGYLLVANAIVVYATPFTNVNLHL